MQSLISKRWVDILENETFNSNSYGYYDLLQSLHRPGKPPKMLLRKVIEIASCGFVGLRLDDMVVVGLEV